MTKRNKNNVLQTKRIELFVAFLSKNKTIIFRQVPKKFLCLTITYHQFLKKFHLKVANHIIFFSNHKLELGKGRLQPIQTKFLNTSSKISS